MPSIQRRTCASNQELNRETGRCRLRCAERSRRTKRCLKPCLSGFIRNNLSGRCVKPGKKSKRDTKQREIQSTVDRIVARVKKINSKKRQRKIQRRSRKATKKSTKMFNKMKAPTLIAPARAAALPPSTPTRTSSPVASRKSDKKRIQPEFLGDLHPSQEQNTFKTPSQGRAKTPGLQRLQNTTDNLLRHYGNQKEDEYPELSFQQEPSSPRASSSSSSRQVPSLEPLNRPLKSNTLNSIKRRIQPMFLGASQPPQQNAFTNSARAKTPGLQRLQDVTMEMERRFKNQKEERKNRRMKVNTLKA